MMDILDDVHALFLMWLGGVMIIICILGIISIFYTFYRGFRFLTVVP
jgi:hypothetical protein